MTTLYLAWQDHESRQWFPVGRLDSDDGAKPIAYTFSYINGAADAKALAHFSSILGFPEFAEWYQSDELFPLFRNRLMNSRRPDRPAYLRRLGMDADDWNPMRELSVSAPYNDTFEMFPAIEPNADGCFATRFSLHGLRHTNPDAIRRTELLEVGERLGVSLELDNPVATHGIMVHTQDYYHVGWLPRYLVDTVHQDDAWKITDVKATVAQVNLDGPLSHRLLVDFRGSLPAGFRPMEHLPQYQPIAPTADYPTNRSSGRKADTT